MKTAILYTGMAILLLILCHITLTIYSNLGLWWTIVFSLFETVKTTIACIFYIKIISRD